MSAFEDGLSAPFGTAMRGSIASVLVDRRYYNVGSLNDTFPKGATRAVFFGVGGGGFAPGGSYNAGGSAFAKKTLSCVAGGQFSVFVGPGGLGGSYGATDRGNDGQDSTVTIGGIVVFKAAGGNSAIRYIFDGNQYNEIPDGRPGLAANCIGDLKISALNFVAANGTLGDKLFGFGTQRNGVSGVAAFPGCGGVSQAGTAATVGAAGMVIAEFWTS